MLLGREGVWLCWAGKLAGLLVEGTVPSWASRRDRDLASRIGLGHQPLLLLLLGLPALRSAEQHMLTLLSMLSSPNMLSLLNMLGLLLYLPSIVMLLGYYTVCCTLYSSPHSSVAYEKIHIWSSAACQLFSNTVCFVFVFVF